MWEPTDRAIVQRPRRRRFRLLRDGLLFLACFVLAYPIAGFAYGLAHAESGSDALGMLDGLVYACVMAIQATLSFGLLDAEPDDPLGGSFVNLYPSILAWAVGLFVAIELALFFARHRRARR